MIYGKEPGNSTNYIKNVISDSSYLDGLTILKKKVISMSLS